MSSRLTANLLSVLMRPDIPRVSLTRHDCCVTVISLDLLSLALKRFWLTLVAGGNEECVGGITTAWCKGQTGDKPVSAEGYFESRDLVKASSWPFCYISSINTQITQKTINIHDQVLGVEDFLRICCIFEESHSRLSPSICISEQSPLVSPASVFWRRSQSS